MGATAADSRAAFDQVAQDVIAAIPAPTGFDFTSALVQAGFDKAQMQVGSSQTTEGKAADALFWSVQFADGCLIGEYRAVQVDPADQNPAKLVPYASATVPPTASGCLLGATVPIP